MTSDWDLLEQHARENSEDAFAEIVRRHVDLVYSAALRQVRSPQLAEEVAQSVFTDLARSAGKMSGTGIPPVSSLAPWLYAVTRRTAIDVIRKESRRQLREQIAVEMNDMNATESGTGVPPVWSEIEPLLDEAMDMLDDADRAAVLLRYFENKSLREVGMTLGTTDDAAQKRVGRAVERLREYFSKRKITIAASGLAVLISANAVQSAPIGLAAAISAAAVLAGTTVSTSTAIAATKTIAMTTLQKTIIGAALTATVGTGIFEAHQASQLRDRELTLQQQQAPLADQMRQLQRERDYATNQLAGLLAENAQLKSHSSEIELLKLRGEVGALRNELETKSQTNNPVATRAVDDNLQQYMPMNEVEKIFTPSSLTNAGLGTPDATIQTYLWTKLLAADTNHNAFATEKLRELSWFPPGFDPLKFQYAEQYPDPSIGIKFWRIDSVVYSAPDTAEVFVGNYDDSGNHQGTVYNLIHDGQSWKVIAPVSH